MAVTAGTTVHDLIDAYPYLLDWLVAYAPEFRKLENPAVWATMGRVATLEAAAGMAGVPLDRFLDDIREEVARRIVAQETAGPATDDPVAGEELGRRQEALKAVIRRLHDGASVDEVKAEFDALASEVDSAQIAAMETSLIAEGMPVEEVQRLCDVHVSVFKEALETEKAPQVPAGHPLDAYRRENEALGGILEELRCGVEDLPGNAALVGPELASGLDGLAQVDIHYLRKENQLFPALERRGVEGPTKVMWALDDDIRGRLKTARALAAVGDWETLAATVPETLGMVEDMVYKEEKILFPTALQVLTDEDWAAMRQGDAEIGYAWVAPPGGVGVVAGAAAAGRPAESSTPAEGPLLLPLPTGSLSLAQLDLLFRNVPFDLTYVDENDRVRFYSEGDRVFPRSPAAVGREVRNCHPPKSVDKVEAILAAFRAGTEDVAEFWIELGGRFIHIRYFALRRPDGEYAGCLEVVQDATHVRSLQGQRRLLDW